jgi:hypothetical protein
MGIALIVWQRVEDAHYLLFAKLIGAKKEVCSILYFSPPTFESRRVVVDRLIEAVVDDKDILSRWGKLNKELQDAAKDRGKIAHYSLDFEIIYSETNPFSMKTGSPHLKPTSHNKISDVLGKGPKKAVTSDTISGFVKVFDDLEQRLEAITKEIKTPPQQPPVNSLAEALRLGWLTEERPPGILNNSPPADPTSDQ